MRLGQKQSEEPFSATDLRLLSSVAAQTGLVLENGRLTAAIKEEAQAMTIRQALHRLDIEPGSPWENGYCESFNSKLREEFLMANSIR